MEINKSSSKWPSIALTEIFFPILGGVPPPLDATSGERTQPTSLSSYS